VEVAVVVTEAVAVDVAEGHTLYYMGVLFEYRLWRYKEIPF
jgi:hypothetical protein